MTKSEAIRLLAMMRAAWPRQRIEKEALEPMVEVYAAALSRVGFDEGKSAVQKLVQTSRFFPTVAEILEQVAEARCGDMEPPELAWQRVNEAISRVGSYHQPLFENPAIQAAVNALGWRQICLDENLSATRARFIDAYRAAREQRIEAEAIGRALPSPYTGARQPAGLEHGSYVFVGKPFALPAQLESGDDEVQQLVGGLAEQMTAPTRKRHLRVVDAVEEFEEPEQ